MAFTLPYLVEAAHLINASNDPTFALRFPRLLGNLVLASLTETPAHIRFPSDDSGQIHGLDGSLLCVGAAPYVPAGSSVWEIKTSAKPRQDAAADYSKRKKQFSAEQAKEITFVFVTSRHWPGKGEDITQWCAKRNAEGHFKEVRAYDATQVVQWLHQHPVVGLFAARQSLRTVAPNFDADLISDFVSKFENSFDPPIPPDLVLCGRDHLAQDIREKGFDVGVVTTVVADTEDESAVFVARSLLSSSDPKVVEDRMVRCIVVSDEHSARLLEGAANATILLLGDAKKQAARLKTANAVVLCHAFGESADLEQRKLPRPSRSAFTQALQGSGLDYAEADAIAAQCGRLISVLRRQHSAEGTVPGWAQGSVASRAEVRAALLAGSWNESHDQDKVALASMAGRDYRELRRSLVSLSSEKDALISEAQRVWAIRAPLDAFIGVGKYIDGEDLERFAEAVALVFATGKDPVRRSSDIIDLDKPSGYSTQLKLGLAQNVLLLAARGDISEVRPTHGTCRDLAVQLVESIPNLRAHPGFLHAFRRELPYLAEAAPDAFLKALDPLFEGEAEAIKWLLTPVENRMAFMSDTYFHGLIWALLPLAWSRDYFAKVAHCLAKIAKFDPKVPGTPGPSPLESLSSLFVSWSPQTSATTPERIRVLEQILVSVPEIAFDLVSRLLPGATTSVSGHQQPYFLEVEERQLTYGDQWEMEALSSRHAITLMGTDPDRIGTVVSHVAGMQDEEFDLAIKQLRSTATQCEPDVKEQIWKLIRHEVSRHTQFRDADWAMDGARLIELAAVMDLIQPGDARATEYLFDEDYPDLEIRDWQEAEGEIRRRRKDVISAFVGQGRFAELVEFAGRVRVTWPIGQSLLDLEVGLSEAMAILIEAVSSPRGQELAHQVSRAAYQVHGAQWLSKLRAELPIGAITNDLYERAVSALFADGAVLEELEQAGKGFSDFYWRNCPIDLRRPDLGLESRIITELLKAGRGVDVLASLPLDLKTIASNDLIATVRASLEAIGGDENQSRRINSYHFERILSELDTRNDVVDDDIATLEWPLVPIIYLSTRRNMAIHRIIASRPDDLLDVISKAYIPEGGTREEQSDRDQQISGLCNKVLFSWNSSPFLKPELDVESFSAWMTQCLLLAGQRGYEKICAIFIGHVLAHSPKDDLDNVWPHRAIRELLEATMAEDVFRGIMTERFNMRGVHSDSIEFYKKHAAEGRRAAEALMNWPRVRNLILSIAKNDQHHSDEAKKDKEKLDQDNRL